MYNGIGLATPRGSGTNGHVQRNWALLKPKEKSKSYTSEGELAALEAATNKQPNKEILDHKRKRRVELKCAEFADILEEQGYKDEAIENKVSNYRNMLLSHDGDLNDADAKCVTETHQLAEAQHEKNARLRGAFGIPDCFVSGSSFDSNRHAKEQLAKQETANETTSKMERERELENQHTTKYELVRTPSPELMSNENSRREKRKKRKLSSSSEEVRKKKKAKKRKRERSGKSKEKKRKKKKLHSSSSSDSTDNSSFEKSDDTNAEDERRKKRKKRKEKRKVKKKRQSTSDSSRESSVEPPIKKKKVEKKYSKEPHNTSRNKTDVNKKKNPSSSSSILQSGESQLRESNKKKVEKSSSKKSEKSDSESQYSHRSAEKYKSSRDYKASNDRRSYKRKSTSPKSKFIGRRYSKTRSRSRSSRSEDRKERSNKTARNPNDNHKRSKSRSKHRSKSVPRSREKTTARNSETHSSSKKRTTKERVSEEERYPKTPTAREEKSTTNRTDKLTRVTSHDRINRRSRTPSISRNKNTKRDECESRRSTDRKSYEHRSRSRGRSSETRYGRRINDSKHDTRNSSIPKVESTKIKFSTKYSSPDIGLTHQPRSELVEKSQLSKTHKSGKYQTLSNSGISNETQEYKKYPELIEKHKCATENDKECYKRVLSNKQPMPVVRLRSSSEGESSEDDCNNIDEEHEKELRMLRLLKTGLAAKAKKSIEKKIPKMYPDPFPTIPVSVLTTPHNQQNLFSSPLASNDKSTYCEPNILDFKMISFKQDKSPSINFHIQLKNNVTSEDDGDGCHRNAISLRKPRYNSSGSRSYTKSKSKSSERKSRSRSSSASSYSTGHRFSHSRSSSSSSSKSSRSKSRSRNRSSSRSDTSSRTSGTASRSRSPSIPRRHGSPSFLDRRRITSKK